MAKLIAAVPDRHDVQPVPTPEEAEGLRQALVTIGQGLQKTARGHIAQMIGWAVSAYRGEKLSDDEADRRLEVYTRMLEDIPPDILREAFQEAIKTMVFFPTVAEIRKLAAAEVLKRRWTKSRAEWLIFIHERDWKEPEPEISEEERLEVKAGLGKLWRRIEERFPSARDPAR